MAFLVFETFEEAEAAEKAISEELGLPKVGFNAKTGEPEPDKQGAERWAEPYQILDGRWIIPSPDENEGVAADSSWFPSQPLSYMTPGE
jgi:hypothetical protein